MSHLAKTSGAVYKAPAAYVLADEFNLVTKMQDL